MKRYVMACAVIALSMLAAAPAASVLGTLDVTQDAGPAVTVHGGIAVDTFDASTWTQDSLVMTGTDRGNGTPYQPRFLGTIPAMITNGWITLNGANYPQVQIATEPSYMLGINSDVGSSPSIVIESAGGGPFVRAYSNDSTPVGEWRSDGEIWALLQLRAQSLGTCDSTHAGTIVFSQGASGAKDSLSVCAKDSSNSYAWRAIY